MAGGSLTKERATDQQCGECRRWFGARGISEHERNCNGEPNDGPTESHIFDPTPDDHHQPMSNNDDDPATQENNDDELTCPECDETDPENIVPTARAIRLFRKQNALTDDMEETLSQYQYYHDDADCRGVFDA